MKYPISETTLRLYAITADGAALDPLAKKRVRAWLEGGVRAIQLREKKLAQHDIIAFGRFLRAITSEYGALFIVNDDPHLAVLLGADGCHLGQEDVKLAEARRVLGPDKIIGLSTHDQVQVLSAANFEVDYIGVGPVFASQSKDVGRPLVGPEFAGWAARKAQIPSVAIGGITLGNVSHLAAAGCTNVAVISALNHTPRPVDTVRAFLEILNAAAESAAPH